MFFQISENIGQAIDVGAPIVETQLRRFQLISDSAIDYSLFKRPLNIGYFDQNLIEDQWFGKSIYKHKSFEMIFLNIRLDMDFNSKYPYAVSYTHLTLPTKRIV